MATVNNYEALYNNMKNRLTVVNDNSEYTIGDYMLMKAGQEKEGANLPAKRTDANAHAITALFSYVNDKLTVKAPPVKDKTIRSFPVRTMVSAVLSALVACTLVLSYGATVSRTATAVPEIRTDVSETGEDAGVTEFYKNV